MFIYCMYVHFGFPVPPSGLKTVLHGHCCSLDCMQTKCFSVFLLGQATNNVQRMLIEACFFFFNLTVNDPKQNEKWTKIPKVKIDKTTTLRRHNIVLVLYLIGKENNTFTAWWSWLQASRQKDIWPETVVKYSDTLICGLMLAWVFSCVQKIFFKKLRFKASCPKNKKEKLKAVVYFLLHKRGKQPKKKNNFNKTCFF